MADTAPALADAIIELCEKDWEAHKNDCSGFLKAVSACLGLPLSGQANDIIDALSRDWPLACDGVEAAQLAAKGKLVVGGLKDKPHGHVVIVVKGPLNRGKYPTAYWGQFGGVGKKRTTINYSWNVNDRDNVQYYYNTPAC